MKKILAVFGVLGLLLANTACSNACDDLDCGACADPVIQKGICDALVDEGDGDACQDAIDTGIMDTCE